MNKKSYVIQVFLILIFGCFGLLYSRGTYFLFSLLCTIILAVGVGYLAIPIMLLINFILGVDGVRSYNKGV